jgi:hypothetical protein
VPVTLSRSVRTPGQLRPVEAMLGILYDMGLHPARAIAAVDVIGQYVFGTTLACVNYLAQQAPQPDVPETGGDSGISPEEFPNLARAIAQSQHLGWDEMYDRGLRALARGLIADKLPRAQHVPDMAARPR